MSAVPPLDGSVILTFDYNQEDVDGVGPGLAWVIPCDNPALAWLVDDTGATPPIPAILGSMPPKAADTDPVHSPQWGVVVAGVVYLPDLWRGGLGAVFNLIATNNGARRKMWGGLLVDPAIVSAFREWATANPALVLAEKPAGVAARRR